MKALSTIAIKCCIKSINFRLETFFRLHCSANFIHLININIAYAICKEKYSISASERQLLHYQILSRLHLFTVWSVAVLLTLWAPLSPQFMVSSLVRHEPPTAWGCGQGLESHTSHIMLCLVTTTWTWVRAENCPLNTLPWNNMHFKINSAAQQQWSSKCTPILGLSLINCSFSEPQKCTCVIS